jgi:hypothetical protein
LFPRLKARLLYYRYNKILKADFAHAPVPTFTTQKPSKTAQVNLHATGRKEGIFENTVETHKNTTFSRKDPLQFSHNNNKERMTHSSMVEDLTVQFRSCDSNEEAGTLVEITGLELLREGIPDILDDISFSDDSSNSSDSYAKDSVDLAKETWCRTRIHRRSSDASFSNDSLVLAKKTRSRNANNKDPKDTVPIETIISVAGKNFPMDLKALPPLDVGSPDVSTIKAVRISNSAA